LEGAKAAELNLGLEIQVDELAATHSRLAQLYGAIGKNTSTEAHLELAASSWQKFSNLQGQIVSMQGKISDVGSD
jgi:hypothetical protein